MWLLDACEQRKAISIVFKRTILNSNKKYNHLPKTHIKLTKVIKEFYYD